MTKKTKRKRNLKRTRPSAPVVVYRQDACASSLLLGMFMGWQLKRFVTWLNKPYDGALPHENATR